MRIVSLIIFAKPVIYLRLMHSALANSHCHNNVVSERSINVSQFARIVSKREVSGALLTRLIIILLIGFFFFGLLRL
jgi:hypothetical protein